MQRVLRRAISYSHLYLEGLIFEFFIVIYSHDKILF